MIEEDYVSYEIAKLLKDKGFNGVCRYYYPDSHTQLISYVDCKQSDMFGPEACIAPTLQMTTKWLREVYKIHVVIYPYGDYSCDNYQFDVYKDDRLIVSKDDGYVTYEQACEAAIKYCLRNLI